MWRRWIIRGIFIMPILLCMAAMALWVRSCYTDDVIFYAPDPYSCYCITNDRGRISFEHDWPTDGDTNSIPVGWSYETVLSSAPDWQPFNWYWWRFGGFAYDVMDGVYAWRAFYIPWWFVILVCALPPTLWLQRIRKDKRIRSAGGCRVCGYDLRASPERCPECGTPVLAKDGATPNSRLTPRALAMRL